MKRPTTLLGRILRDAGLQTSLDVNRDVQEIEHRVKHEGISFLTITLPELGDALDAGLAQGRLVLPSNFKKWKRQGRLPALLRGFFSRVFDVDGFIFDEPCIDSIEAIRQVTRCFKKLLLPCSPARVKRAFERYIENEASVFDSDSLGSYDSNNFRAVCGYLWAGLETFSSELYCSEGKFGSGATGERYRSNERWTLRQWPERGESFFPLDHFGSHNWSDLDEIALIDQLSEQPARVVQVPKTLKTPRIISVEPSYMMLRQQSILLPLVDALEGGRFGFKSIRFSDQSVNKEMARVGSLDGSLATIDLSDASDLVSNDLVKMIFGRVAPTFLDYIQNCRTTRAQLPSGEIVSLKKFASMGSALCFPIEAMTFLTIVVYSMVMQSGKRPSRKLVMDITANVQIYGDDIIVPADVSHDVMHALQLFGLKVNNTKSFTTGFFRESCGGDYYKGNNVTPVYLRRPIDHGFAKSPESIVSIISTSNQLYLKGYWNTAQYLRDLVEEECKMSFPRSTEPIGGITFTSVNYNTGLRYNKRFNGYAVKTICLTSRVHEDNFTSVRGAMFNMFHRRRGCFASNDNVTTEFNLNQYYWSQKKFRTDVSDKPYALKAKRRLVPTHVGS